MSINDQVLDLSRDTRVVILSNEIVDHVTYQPIRTTVVMDMNLYDITANTSFSHPGVTLTFMPTVDFYRFDVSEIITNLVPEHKYVAVFREPGSNAPDYVDGSIGIRPFYLMEFCVTENRLLNIMGSYPYRIRCQISGGSKSYIEWGQANDDGFASDPIFHAPAYQGGVGQVFAVTPEKVTHRGTVLPFDANRYL